MSPSTGNYIIGIDLGTTNSVVAYAPMEKIPGEPREISAFEISQPVAEGVREERAMLPSFLLLPDAKTGRENGQALAWDHNRRVVVGAYARDRGAELPGNLAASAKSWLCNPLVDREAPILPWQGTDEAGKLSPVEASAAILQHIRRAWDAEMAGQDEGLQMARQQVYLTVPASFDAVARELTVQAATLAGLPGVTLLEEPQAAFYAWLESSGDAWRRQVAVGDRILVCDVGGGTSDFSLIEVKDHGGEVGLERVAIGEHLLVGGDNMDLTLAHLMRSKLAQKGTKLDAWQMRALVHHCREAKETLLNRREATSHTITLLGRGAGLIGGTITTEMTRTEVEAVIADGFFPACDISDRPQPTEATGIREMGLAYAADPAVTRHLAQFLTAHQGHGEPSRAGRTPRYVLFNGGVMKAAALRRRIVDRLAAWQDGDEGPGVTDITGSDLDRAVARGAVYYGMAAAGDGIRIRSGLGRSYYMGIAAAMPAVPGLPVPTKALCVAPFGMEEDSTAHIDGQTFTLVVGETARFDLLGSSLRQADKVGEVVEDWEDQIGKISTMQTVLDGEAGRMVPVTLEIRVTAVGTLEIWCRSTEDGDRRWRLAFDVREKNSKE